MARVTWRRWPGGPTRRVSSLAEAVGYIGTILVLAGAAASIGQRWDRLSTTWRLVPLLAATVLFFALGWFLRSSAEPAFLRLVSVTWAVSTAAFAGSAIVVTQYYQPRAEDAFVLVAATSTGYAAALWLARTSSIQHAALFAGILLTTASVLAASIDALSAWMVALPLWAIGLVWAAGGWWRRLRPWYAAVLLGLLVALAAPASLDYSSALRFSVGIGTAGLVMVLGVAWRFAAGLAMASVAMLGYVIAAVVYYFGDTLGVPTSLTVAGALVLVLAASAARWHWFASPDASHAVHHHTHRAKDGQHRAA